jgi:hypothetical protein
VAGTGLAGPPGGVAAGILDAYVAQLAGALVGPTPVRAAILAEVTDGLWTAVEAHSTRGLGPAGAARAAVAEFGDPRLLAAGFPPELVAATSRRVGLGLVRTGPLVGLSWVAMVAASTVGTGGRPPAGLAVVAALFAVVLVVAVPAAMVSIAVTGRLARRLPAGPRLAPTAAAVGAAACVVGDLGLLAGLLVWLSVGGGLAWPLAVAAAAASAVRLTLAGRAARRCVAARATLA